jgi:Raf kinase inhibitor-like YbhB/YbcL family protein
MTLVIRSAAFPDHGEIPRIHTCQGQDLSPPLEFSGVPPTARSLALVVDDPDAPDPAAPKRTYVHWILYDLPADTSGLPAGVSVTHLPRGTRQGLNDWKRTGYGGPCPPIGRHRYFFKLYALDTPLGEMGAADKAGLLSAMEGHVVARAELVGTYQKHD